jgi:hypothetical protein
VTCIESGILNFVTLNQITWSVLVCEDLARKDPAADLIRAVGPNLLIALLMDGPQLKSRWPGRWNDTEEGEVEISLDKGDDACVLTLECRKLSEAVAAERLKRAGVTLGPNPGITPPKERKASGFSRGLVKRLAGG